MRLLEANPRLTQRELARELGISLGGLNDCPKAPVQRGRLPSAGVLRWPSKVLRGPTL
jgi:hypothetical protein